MESIQTDSFHCFLSKEQAKTFWEKINPQIFKIPGNAIIQSKFYKKQKITKCCITRYYNLYPFYLSYGKKANQQTKYIPLRETRVRFFEVKKKDKTQYSFKLFRHQLTAQLYTTNKSLYLKWKAYFQKYTILSNFTEMYKTIKYLSKGSTAKVFKAINKKTNEFVAVKAFKKLNMETNSFAYQSLKQEIKVLDILGKHSQIAESYEIYESEEYVYLVMEYLDGGELTQRIKERSFFSENDISNIMKNLLIGISYIHQKGFMHRDIKPRNIIMVNKNSEYKLKIVDFGLCEQIKVKKDEKRNFNRCGTLGFMAPEIFESKKVINYDQKVDIFSLGVILYILLTGKFPFKSNDFEDVYKLNSDGLANFNVIELNFVSNQAKDLLKKMLDINSKKRPNANECLDHDFFLMVPTEVNLRFTIQNVRGSKIFNPSKKSHQISSINSSNVNLSRYKYPKNNQLLKQQQFYIMSSPSTKARVLNIKNKKSNKKSNQSNNSSLFHSGAFNVEEDTFLQYLNKEEQSFRIKQDPLKCWKNSVKMYNEEKISTLEHEQTDQMYGILIKPIKEVQIDEEHTPKPLSFSFKTNLRSIQTEKILNYKEESMEDTKINKKRVLKIFRNLSEKNLN